MKKLLLFIALILTFLLTLTAKSAIATDQNIFGLHLSQTTDIYKAKSIINSGKGDWGWATIVIRLDLLDKNMWQTFFDECRRSHIIPIVRISTFMDQGFWRRPETSEIDQISSFLNSLNWPTQQQHVILFNEINHGTEWGGEVDVRNYADMFIYTSQKLKSLNPNFFILGPSLDLAAPSNLPDHQSASNVYTEIYQYRPEYFDSVDGLSSHSYPNHGYIGTPKDQGQHSIRGYEWELSFIKSLGISKDYPVFITETGWPHRQGEKNDNKYYTAKTSAEFLAQAIEVWSKDRRVKAITPFTFNYPYQPFDHFSWVDKTETLYPEYQQIVDLDKSQNTPTQTTSYQLNYIHLPLLLLHNIEYQGTISLKNTGQSIWGETSFCLEPNISPNIKTNQICVGDQQIEPGNSQIITFKFTVTDESVNNSFIGWDNLDATIIEPTILKGKLYRPKTGIKDRLQQTFQNIFGSFLVK